MRKDTITKTKLLLLLLLMLVTTMGGLISADEGETLAASGTIQANKVRVATELGGRILTIYTPVGRTVRSGELLVELDATPLLLQLSVAEAAIATAQADLAVTKAGPRAEEIAAAQAALELAKAQRDGALAAWENAQEAIEDPQELNTEISKAYTQVELAKQGVELAEADLASTMMWRDQQKEGSTQHRVADLQVQAAEQALAAAQADQETAQRLHYWLWTIREEPLGLITQANVAQGKYQLAEAGVVVARAKLDDLLAGPTPEEIAVAEAAVGKAEAEANVLQVQVELLRLSSPITGVVLDQSLQAGELAAPAATILTLANLSQVELVIYVPENRIGQVQLGQAVKVSVDSFPGQVFEGQVARIRDQAEFTPRNVATAEERLNTFFAVEIRLPNPDGELKPGMPADSQFD